MHWQAEGQQEGHFWLRNPVPHVPAGHAGFKTRTTGEAEEPTPSGIGICAADAAGSQAEEGRLTSPLVYNLRQLRPARDASIPIACSTLGELAERGMTAVIPAAQRRCFCMYILHPKPMHAAYDTTQLQELTDFHRLNK